MRRNGQATAMAGEFLVMSQLFRLGHEASLTLGNAKDIDILVRTKRGKHREVSVKAVCGGGKWGVSSRDESSDKARVYVLLHFRRFEEISALPVAYVIPAPRAEPMKRPWHDGKGIYYSGRAKPASLGQYLEAWHLI